MRIQTILKPHLKQMQTTTLLILLLAMPIISLIQTEFASAQATTILTPKWTVSGLGSNWEGGLVIGDITGDGREEIVFAGGGNDTIHVLNGATGARIATYTNTRIGQYCQPQLYDIDGDGVLDILVPLYYEPGLAALRYSGSSSLQQMWIANIQRVSGESTPSGSVMAKPVAGDIDGDGRLDIFIASQDVSPVGQYDGTIVRLNNQGVEVARNFAWRACSGGLSLADTDNDGTFEIYQGDRQMGYRDGGYGKGTRSFWAENLTERWNRLDFLSSSQSPVLADVNKDGVLDVIAGMYREMNVLNSANGEWINCVRDDLMSVHYGITVYDIDSDGNLELLCNDGDHDDDPVTDVYDLVTGEQEAQLSLSGGDSKWSPLVADIDPTHPGMEIISVPNGTTLESGYWRGAIRIFSSNYEILQTVTRFNTARLGSQLAYPVVQDIDNDNRLELVTHASSGTIYVFDTAASAPTQRIRSEVTYYGEKRTGVAVYQPAPWAPDYWTAPLVAANSPADNALAVSTTTSQLSFRTRDHQSDALTYTVTTTPNIGSRSGSISTGTYNWNTINVPFSNLAYDTTYKWTVTVNDGTQTTQRTYTFRTEQAPKPGNTAPTQATPTLAGLDGIDAASTFQCNSQGSNDANGDTVTNVYRWAVNGNPVAKLLLPFDTRGATSTMDFSGFGNNGIVKGATWVPNGKVGGAYSFDGKDDSIKISDGGLGYFNNRTYTAYPNHEELGGYGNWNGVTVEAWIYLAENNYGTRVIGKIPSYALGFQSNSTTPNMLSASVWPAQYGISEDDNRASTDRERSVRYSERLQLNTWYHIAFTYESGVGLKLYLNGELVSQSTAFTGPVKESRGEPVYIGSLVEPFAGMIDEVKLYSYAQPAQQILNSYVESRYGDSSSSMFSPSGIGVADDLLACQVTPTDSWANGAARNSPSITIGSGLPPEEYALSINLNGGGSVTKNPDQGTYSAGTDVTLTAIPNQGWIFSGWSGDLTGAANPTTITMNSNKAVTATFIEEGEPPLPTEFSDGFETGDFSKWTSTSRTTGETTTIITSPVHAGTYSAEFASTGDVGYEKAYLTRTLSPAYDTVDVQGTFLLAQNGIVDSSDRIKLVELRAGSTIIASAGLIQRSGTLQWWLETRDGTGWVETYAQATTDLSDWFTLELQWQNSASAGGGTLIVNGVSTIQVSNDNTSNYGGCTQVRVGLPEAYNCAALTVVADDITIADQITG